MERYLVTTAIKETWKYNSPLVFLGDWCLSLGDKEQLTGVDYVVQDYHWNDRDVLYQDYLYLKKLHKNLIVCVADELNSYHGCEHSVRYWEIVAGPWLMIFTQSVYDRWKSIDNVVKNYKINGTCQVEAEIPPPYNFLDFHDMAASDYWNHYIFSKIINYVKLDCTIEKTKLNQSYKAKKNPNNTISKFKLKSKKIIEKTLHYFDFFSIFNKVFFVGSGFSVLNQTKLLIKLRQMPVYIAKSPNLGKNGDFYERKKCINFNIKPANNFENFLEEILSEQIPLKYVEGYSDTLHCVKKIWWPKSPKVVFTSANSIFDDFFKIWVASKVEKETKLVVGQHGGLFGAGKWETTEDHDISISDKYFSWGWESKGVRPLPSQKIINLNCCFPYNKQGCLLHVLGAVPRYSRRMFSATISSQMLKYIDEQILFISLLDEKIRGDLKLRSLDNEYGWNEIDRIKAYHPNLAQCHVDKMRNSMKSARLFIGTMNTTAPLEALAVNMPTILFWNPGHWELRECAIEDYDNLKKVGILHDTPESAAKMVNKIWDDPASWWWSNDTQKVRTQFCYKFARMSNDWSSQWQGVIKKL